MAGTPSRRGPSVGTLELAKATPTRRKVVPVEREYVGIDLHRRRSVIVRKNAAGEVIAKTHIDNSPLGSAAQLFGRVMRSTAESLSTDRVVPVTVPLVRLERHRSQLLVGDSDPRR